MTAVLGPVYNAAHTPPSLGSAWFAEVIGLFLMYVAIFGEIKLVPATFSPVINIFVFGGAGVAFVASSFAEIRRAHGNEVTGIIVALAIGLPLAGLEFSRWMKFRGADSWPTTLGTVESVGVKEVRTRSTHYFVLETAYSYSIGGEYYAGRFTRQFDTESAAWDYAANLKGRPVSLKYNPADVGTSCLPRQ